MVSLRCVRVRVGLSLCCLLSDDVHDLLEYLRAHALVDEIDERGEGGGGQTRAQQVGKSQEGGGRGTRCIGGCIGGVTGGRGGEGHYAGEGGRKGGRAPLVEEVRERGACCGPLSVVGGCVRRNGCWD